MRYGAVITASKNSTKMAQYKKLNISDSGIIERVANNFSIAGVRDIVIVMGNNAEQTGMLRKLRKSLKHLDAAFVEDPEFETADMFASAKLGFEQLGTLPQKCDRVFFCPSDVPFFSDRTVSEEMRVMDENPEAGVIVPERGGRGGHPLLIDSRLLPEILAYRGEEGMRGACGSLSPGSVVRAEVQDEGAFMKHADAEELKKLVDLHNDHISHPVIKLSFASTSSFFGPGSVALLNEVDRCGNVRDACESCGFSYSKGWTILKRCEEKFGCKIVERQAGGQNGGGAYVTEKGRELLAVYEQLNAELCEMAEERFSELMYEHGLKNSKERD